MCEKLLDRGYLGITQSLLSIAARLNPDYAGSIALEEAIKKVMLPFSLSQAEGSICVHFTKNELTDKEIELLKDAKLLVLMNESNGNRYALANQQSLLSAPFVLDDQDTDFYRLYSQRNFASEMKLAERLVDAVRIKPKFDRPAKELLEAFKAAGMAGQTGDFLEKCRRAADITNDAITQAMAQHFAIITGGPGTGKTTAVVKLLACLLANEPDLKIGLAAPTGKAASRMMESVNNSCSSAEDLFDEVKKRLSTIEAKTIHKWLTEPDLEGNRPDEQHQINLDVLIVDEASMIDMQLALRLVKAINFSRTRLIFLGDKHQLAAVGPGSILGDLTSHCEAFKPFVRELKESFRFDERSNIGKLARAVNHFGSEDFNDDYLGQLLSEESQQKAKDYIEWVKLDGFDGLVSKPIKEWIDKRFTPYIEKLSGLKDAFKDPESRNVAIKEIWKIVKGFRLLTAQRIGANSVTAINDHVERTLKAALGVGDSAKHYLGRVVIARRNNDILGVYNGDVGIVVPTKDGDDRFEVFFGDRQEDTFLAAGLLPEHDTAFVMTIHQSQGSEFDDVAVVMPCSKESGLATRELLYTGITRAKKAVTIFSDEEVFNRALRTYTERTSALGLRCTVLYNECQNKVFMKVKQNIC